MSYYIAAPNWYYRSGYTKAIIWVPDTGESIATEMVPGDPLFNETTERRTTAGGILDERARVNSISFVIAGDLEAKTVRQWANRSGNPAKVNAILLGRGRTYQFLEDVPCLYDAVDGAFGSLSGDRVILHTEKMSPGVYQDIDLLASHDFETDWTPLTGTGRTNDWTPALQRWQLGADAGVTTAVYTDKILPNPGGTFYLSVSVLVFSGSPTGTIKITPLDFDEVDTVAYGSESNASQTESITGVGRFELEFTMPSDAWGVRLSFTLTAGVSTAQLRVNLPLLTVKSTSVEPSGTPYPTFGITGSFDGSGTYVEFDDPSTSVDNGDGTYTFTIPDEALVSDDGILTVIRTDNDWDQP